MRITVNEYASGGRWAVEATDDGRHAVSEWDGPRQDQEQVCAFVEVACEDKNEQSVRKLLDSLDWLLEELKRRKGESVPVR